MSKINYPKARKLQLEDDYHGFKVPDPYRWLEDVDAKDTLDWVRAENEITYKYLDEIPRRKEIRQRLTDLWNYSRASTIHHRGGCFFQFRNSGLQNQDVLYVMDSPMAIGRILLDPNTLSEDGTISLNTWSISDNGNWLAYAISKSGSDWMEWHIRDIPSCKDLPEKLEWSKFSNAAWAKDNSGFYYCQYDKPVESEKFQDANYNQKVYFHKLNTSQEIDVLVYGRDDHPEWGFETIVSDDSQYLVFHVTQGTDTRNRLFYMDLLSDGNMIELIPDLEASFQFLGNDDSLFYFRTDHGAPRYKVIAIDIKNPARENWIDIISENENTLEFSSIINDQFINVYLEDAHDLTQVFSINGDYLGEVKLPTLGSVSVAYESTIAGRRTDIEMFYLFHSFAYPATIFRYEFFSGKSEIIFQPSIDFPFDRYTVEQAFVSSRDGTHIPLFLVHRKDMILNGDNPTLLYGYGGFNIPITPTFNINRLAWLDLGGVYAVAVLRGGGEYGEDWHQEGMIHRKQNVFDDFIACAEWLISSKITCTPKLAIEGRSNGGLLVGACLTQRPDLFGACLPIVGVMDMLRFHLFTIGWAWVSDYGCSKNPDEFKTLISYSPYHNLQDGVSYPPTMVVTSDHDDRVVPGHSFKFSARLQECQGGDAPVLIRIQTKAGHGAGKPTTILIEEMADMYAFLLKNLGIE